MKLHRFFPKRVRTSVLNVVSWSRSLLNYRLLNTKRLYAWPEIQHLRKLFGTLSVDCVFDIGANEGQYATMLRREVGYRGRIISFEPDPIAVLALTAAAQNDNNWEVYNIAVADRCGQVRLNIMRDSKFNSLSSPRYDETSECIEANQVTEQVDVPAKTLADVLMDAGRSGPCDRPFLKLDTQGFDMTIVSTSHECLAKFVGVQTEVAFKRLYESVVHATEVLRWYSQHHFEISAIVANTEGHFPLLVESDFIFIRRDLATAMEQLQP